MTTPRTPQTGVNRPQFRRGGRRRRQCYCKEAKVDYKDVSSIRRFITDRGRIEPGKKSGNCAKCHRSLTIAIKRARHLALLPYAPEHLRVTGAVATNAPVSEEEEPETTSDEESSELTESVNEQVATEELEETEKLEVVTEDSIEPENTEEAKASDDEDK